MVDQAAGDLDGGRDPAGRPREVTVAGVLLLLLPVLSAVSLALALLAVNTAQDNAAQVADELALTTRPNGSGSRSGVGLLPAGLGGLRPGAGRDPVTRLGGGTDG